MIYVDAVNEIISIIREHFPVPHWSTWYHLSHLSFSCLCSKSSVCREMLLFKKVVGFVLFLLFRIVLIRARGGWVSFSKLIYFHEEIKKLGKKKKQSSVLYFDRKTVRFIRTLSWPQWIYCTPDLSLYWRKSVCDKEMNISAMIFTLEIYMVF